MDSGSLRTRRLLLGLVGWAVAAGAACSGPAFASPLVTTDPPLRPSFHTGVPDYTVVCDAGKKVHVAIAPPAGSTAAVDGGPRRGGAFSRAERLVPGRAFTVSVQSGAGTRNYSIRCLPRDFPHWSFERNGKPQASWYVLTPTRSLPERGFAAVFDANGVPVWWLKQQRSPMNAQLLPDGNLAWGHSVGHGPGGPPIEERALDGQLVRTYGAVGGETNQHEFQLLPDGNAMVITYPLHDGVDLSPWGGPSAATVFDGEVQEIDPNGKLLWAWNTRGHIGTGETGHWLRTLIADPPPTEVGGRFAYDLVHMNSVEPVPGGFVVSARYLDAVYEVDGASGGIVWKLGGTHTSKSLRIVGDPQAKKDFGGQHDARILDGGRTLTVYDNGRARKRRPRALEFRIDRVKRTATLVSKIRFSRAGKASFCCGSARRLPGGDWVVAWGNTPWVTEQTSSGRPVLSFEFAPTFWSYRAQPVLPGVLSRDALRRGMDAMAP